jgi:hypothetical protein
MCNVFSTPRDKALRSIFILKFAHSLTMLRAFTRHRALKKKTPATGEAPCNKLSTKVT